MNPLTRRLEHVAARVALARATTHVLERPDRLPRSILAMRGWGQGIVGAAAAAAARYPSAPAIIDEAGSLSFNALWTRSGRMGSALVLRHGAGPGVKVGLLARNHRGFVEGLLAILRTGADAVLLNTEFAGPQLADVATAEGIAILLHDDDLADIARAAGDVVLLGEHAQDDLASAAGRVAPPERQGHVVILTSGTTGRPKGAARPVDSSAVDGSAAIMSRIPLRLRDTQVLGAPLFHGWGLTHLGLGLGRSATTVVARRFDALSTLDAVSNHQANVLVVVPQMLQRILALSPDVLVQHDTSALRVIASSGGPLGADLARRAMARFGPILYNLYGSTEVAVATIATPEDLHSYPGGAGRPVPGVRVRILDEQGERAPRGEVGRIFVGSRMRFHGYTGGGGREERDGLLGSGDLGRFVGRQLFVEGREDDMIVSGGENVFPTEVEELLMQHPAVAEVAVVGVPDTDFGQALAAFVVVQEGATLAEDDVRTLVREHLARFKVPRQVVFLDALPRTATGKLQRRSLAERLAQSSPT